MSESSHRTPAAAGRRLNGISEIRGFFRANATPVYFFGPTAFNLLGIDRWVRNFTYVVYSDWRAADAADPDAASDATKGAALVHRCLNAPYPQRPERFPPLQHGVLTAAERTGALLVTLETSTAGGKPMTEDLPLAATTVKGRTRAAMTRELLKARAAVPPHCTAGPCRETPAGRR